MDSKKPSPVNSIIRIFKRSEPQKKGAVLIRLLIGAALGALAGFAYYRFIGCHGGTCPITGNPYISSVYGAFMGALLAGM